MNPVDLINHLRLCSLADVNRRLEQYKNRHPEWYEIIENFILSCKPTLRKKSNEEPTED